MFTFCRGAIRHGGLIAPSFISCLSTNFVVSIISILLFQLGFQILEKLGALCHSHCYRRSRPSPCRPRPHGTHWRSHKTKEKPATNILILFHFFLHTYCYILYNLLWYLLYSNHYLML